jgi:hypothetical protein
MRLLLAVAYRRRFAYRKPRSGHDQATTSDFEDFARERR